MRRIIQLPIRSLSSISNTYNPQTLNIAYGTKKNTSAIDIFNNSCYNKVDFKINQNSTTTELVQRFTSLNVGCLAVTDDTDKVVGVISERDYISKVAAEQKNSDDIKVKDICTYGHKIIVANKNDSLEKCMNKMLFKDIRHLLIVDEKNKDFVGMISIRDLVKEIIENKNEIITKLSFFNMGKGANFGSE
jgi:predicted transcriptional regulator